MLQAELLAGARIDAVVERQFQDFHQVEISGEDEGLLAEGAGFDAAAAPAGPGVFQRFALAKLLLDHTVGVEDRREAVSLADHAQGMLQHRVGRFPRQLQIAAGLEQVHLVDDVQQQVRNLVRSVRAVGQQSADIDVGKIGVRAAFGSRHSDLRRRGMVVELDEKRFEQFPALVRGSACRRQGPFDRTAAGADRDGRD